MPVVERSATPRQLYVCRRIAERTGRTFAEPLTFVAASRFIAANAARSKRSKGNGPRLTPTRKGSHDGGTSYYGGPLTPHARDGARASGFV